MNEVKVISMVNGRIGVNVPDLHFSRQWLKKGSSIKIKQEILEELLYDSGFRYMINNGMLYIEDLAVKKELGLEPEDTDKPVNIIVLSESEMNRYMTTLPLWEFKNKVTELSYEQIQNLADYAIEKRLTNIDRCNLIKEICGKDIIKAIQLNDANEEN